MIGANDVIWGGSLPVIGNDLPDDRSESRPTSLSSAGAISTSSLLSPKTRLALKQGSHISPSDVTGGMYSCVRWGGGGEGGNFLASMTSYPSVFFIYCILIHCSV